MYYTDSEVRCAAERCGDDTPDRLSSRRQIGPLLRGLQSNPTDRRLGAAPPRAA
jgi:hypothetical protein